jgi:hypothetical protein
VKPAHGDGIESTSLDPRGRQRNKNQNATPAKDEIRKIGKGRDENSDDHGKCLNQPETF